VNTKFNERRSVSPNSLDSDYVDSTASLPNGRECTEWTVRPKESTEQGGYKKETPIYGYAYALILQSATVGCVAYRPMPSFALPRSTAPPVELSSRYTTADIVLGSTSVIVE